MAQKPIPGAAMSDGVRTPISEGLLDRVVRGVKYVVNGGKADEWFGPGQPQQPLAQNLEGVLGRRFDYATGYNMRRAPRDGEGVTFDQLRALADGYDLLRLVIETRKDQMEALSWHIGPRKEVEELERAKQRVEKAKKAQAKVRADNEALAAGEQKPIGHKSEPEVPELPQQDPRVKDLTRFFRYPDGENGWKPWLRALLEDMFVIDAATLYPRPTLDGGLYGLELVDGATVKRLLDPTGRTPLPPDPAYQQVIKGVPAADYNRDELIYRPRNIRTNKVYGYSHVEQVIMTVNIALRRQIHQLQYFTEGNIPEALIGVPEDWNPDQIKQFQEYWDSLLEGNTAQRRHAKFVPGGIKPTMLRGDTLKDEFDEWLSRIVCFAFSISPQALVKQMNRATAETAYDQATAEGLTPVMNWVKDLMDYVIQKYFGHDDLEFKWDEEDESSPEVQMKVLTGYVQAKIMTDDEAREKIGLDALTPDQRSQLAPPAPPPMLPAPGGAGIGGGPQQPQGQGGGGSTDKPVGKLRGSGLRKASKPIARDRASITLASARLRAKVADSLAAARTRVARELGNELGKADSDAERARKLLATLTLDELRDIAPDLADVIEDVVSDGGAEGLAQVLADVTDDQLKQVNARAADYAKTRSGELVTQLEDSTREMLRGTVGQAIEEGWSNDQLAAALADEYAFSPERAETVARTETAYADVQGNLEGYKASGVVQGKQWIVAQDEFCDDCQALDGVTVGLDESFPNDGGDGPPLHPNCRCDVLPVLIEEETK